MSMKKIDIAVIEAARKGSYGIGCASHRPNGVQWA